MQTPNHPSSQQKLSRAEFLERADAQVHVVTAELAKIHGEPPCLYAIDPTTLSSWTEQKQEETLVALRAAVAHAETLVQHAERERAALWEQSDAAEEDRSLPPIILLKSIREDLAAYEGALHFVRSRKQ
jgi:hypothetical protein